MTTPSPCARTLRWAGGEHRFDLSQRRVIKILAGELVAMPRRLVARIFTHKLPLAGQYGGTPAACLKRFEDGVYSVEDVETVILLGLIGGGMADDQAETIISAHVDGQPLAANAMLAFDVIAALFLGSKTDAGAAA